MALRLLGYGLVVLGIAIAAFVLFRNTWLSTQPIPYSPQQMLSALWSQYKVNNLEPGTYRTLDKSRDNVTTSEGQSYSMLRAVWMGDKATFDAEWNWTKGNLSRSGDHLFAWLWGKRTDGTYGVLTERSGNNSAADGDTNIALALIFAYSRWQDPQYLAAARSILADLWNEETLVAGGQAYVLADNLEKTSPSPTALVNPSYLEPAAYRIFALVDPAHPWAEAVNGSYAVIRASASQTLGAPKSAGLPADWVAVNKSAGAVSAPAQSGTDTNFGYDALRVPWNLALDWTWFHDQRDQDTLKQFSFLGDAYRSKGYLAATYTHDGRIAPNYDYESPSMYGGTIGYFMTADPSLGRDIYRGKLAFLFTPDWSGWRQGLPYYDDNWAWFGIGLYNNLLPNLTAGLPPSFFTQSQS